MGLPVLFFMVKKTTKTTVAGADAIKSSTAAQLPHYKLTLKCQSPKQKEFVKALKEDKNEICFGIGSAGTGKTFLSIATALSLLKNASNGFKKIVIFVTTCESTKELQLGYLKGELQDKIEPYRQNSINTIEKILEQSGNTNPKELAKELIDKGFIQFDLINFIKGKTYENCICILEEAEDLSREDMKLILTRKGGPTCKMICTGDTKQINRSDLRKNIDKSGLKFSADILGSMEQVAVTTFTNQDIVRDPLLTEIITRFEQNM